MLAKLIVTTSRPALHHPAEGAVGLINAKISEVRGGLERSSEGR
jgi:hypothetical protein